MQKKDRYEETFYKQREKVYLLSKQLIVANYSMHMSNSGK